MSHPHIGSSFESFLEEEGIREEVEALAQKRVLAACGSTRIPTPEVN